MEKNLKIKVDKTHAVYGRLTGSLKQPLVIIVHGLPCTIYEGIYEGAATWFEKHGYAVFRFNLYDFPEDARQLIDSTLASHASDLDAIVAYFQKKGVKKIFVAGHSFGGPTILTSKQQAFTAAALWDPSYDISFAKEKYGFPGGTFIKELNGYFMRWGANVIIGKAMANEIDALSWDDLTPNFRRPLHIIAASKGVLVKGAKRYNANANEPKALTIIKGATHYFDGVPGVREELYRTTKRWFDKF